MRCPVGSPISPPIKMDRVYQPEPAALDALLEILHLLLLETAESTVSVGTDSACIPSPREQ